MGIEWQINDPCVPKRNRIDSVYGISIWLLKDYKSTDSVYNSRGLDRKRKYWHNFRIQAQNLHAIKDI
jgi:hypothetical protein